MKNKPKISTDLEKVTDDADCIVLVTDHDVFKEIKPDQIKNMKNKRLIDTRNILDYKRWEEAGFTVKVLGIS